MLKETILRLTVNYLKCYVFALSLFLMPSNSIAQSQDSGCSLFINAYGFDMSDIRTRLLGHPDEIKETSELSQLVHRHLAEKGYVFSNGTIDYILGIEFKSRTKYYSDDYDPTLKVNLQINGGETLYYKESTGNVRCVSTRSWSEIRTIDIFDLASKPIKWLANYNSRCDNNADINEFIKKRRDKLIVKMISELPTCSESRKRNPKTQSQPSSRQSQSTLRLGDVCNTPPC